MASNPKRALILYCSQNADIDTPTLDALCQRGCSGQLLLERSDSKDARKQDIVQLLGLSDCKNDQMKTRLTERFGNMKLGLISPYAPVAALAEVVTFYSTEIPDDLMAIDVDVLLVDTTKQHMEDIMVKLLDTTPHLLKCVVMRAAVQQQQIKHAPQQSSVTKNGVSVNVHESNCLVCGYWHDGSTRRDHVERFRVDDMITNGCNGSTLAWHYLAEIGHKLGHVPKYGA
ncbi:hypothetical protein BJV82DRAFT_250350 [Fennellomyces sp. T-0311]|nr:hypothetical protein BJV82DRAFT_250350 [Fennellomyces sp. T-0311]